MADQGDGGRAPLRGDEAELFRDFNRQFVRTVQSRTNAPREIVDDACGFAWQQFMRDQPDRERNWRAWMITTAERETWRLHRGWSPVAVVRRWPGACHVGRTGPARPGRDSHVQVVDNSFRTHGRHRTDAPTPPNSR
jgi:hypothetical protein